MNPPVYKTVTTKEGVMLFVDFNRKSKDGEYAYGAETSLTNAAFAAFTQDNMDKAKEYVGMNFYPVVAQPIESNIPNVPYYELTPQEETVECRCILFEGMTISDIESCETNCKSKKCNKNEYPIEEIEQALRVGFTSGRLYESNRGVNMEQTVKNYMSSLRQPMKIVSAASPVMKLQPNQANDNIEYLPETYEKDGKTFIRLNFKTEE